MQSVIQLENLTKYYGKHRGIENLSLEVKEGEIFGFIGPNGAGKSTTIRTMLGLLRKNEGKIKIFGKPMPEMKQKILQQIGYMPSEAGFYSGMKVRDVLRFSSGLYGEDCFDRAKILCERMKLDTGKKIEELSLGNRKKVSIVCALQHEAGLYILDEPTSGLDPLMQKEFFSLLREKNQTGATIFLSSHILGEVQRYCHRAAIIRDGKLVAVDEIANICKTTARRVTVTGVDSLKVLKGIDKTMISGEKRTEEGITFLYRGEIQRLIQALAGISITDLTIMEPDLEEIFLHFYEGREEK